MSRARRPRAGCCCPSPTTTAACGTLDRSALQRLLAAVDEGRVDRIVVYKIDRLTRSLSDFARIVERLDAAGASFVSVTQ